MSSSIAGISVSRVSTQYNQQMLVGEVQHDQQQLDQVETQMSTGQQFQLPSENPSAAQRVLTIQSLLQRKTQLQTNITTNQAYLSQTDTSLSQASSLLSSVRAAAISVVGSTASDSQRTAVIQQIDQSIQQMVNIGNQQFNGRYLFAGSATGTQPFQVAASGNVTYAGNADQVSSYSDLGSLFATNVSGAEAFGAISQPVSGADLTAAVNYNTALTDLNQGAGVPSGSIAVSDGHTTSVVDLSQAKTLGDVAALIRDNPPAGRTLNVEVTSKGLTIQLDPTATNGSTPGGDNLSVQEAGGGTTAASLGILSAKGAGAGPLVGNTLTASLTGTTSLADLLGTEATGFVPLPSANSGIVLDANTNGSTAPDGTLLNGVTVQFVNDAPGAGQETAVFNPGVKATGGSTGTPGTLTVHIQVGKSQPQQIVDAINRAAGLPFTAQLDPTAPSSAATAPVKTLPPPIATSGGSGTVFDQYSGLQVVNDGKTTTIDLSGAHTIQDVLSAIDSSGTGLVAQINQARTGIDVSSTVSGADFSIGENGGQTATQLGIRTFTDDTKLADLNFGQGVGVNTVTAGGPDFTISQPALGVQFDVSVAGIQTVGQLCQQITSQAQAAGSGLYAQLTASGNGIELVDYRATDGAFTVASNTSSTAAVDLGLVPAGQTDASSSQPTTASANVSWGPNTALTFTAKQPGVQGNALIVFQEQANLQPGAESVSYNAAGNTLTFQVGPQTTANTIVNLLNDGVSDPAATAAFSVAVDKSSDPTNDASGVVGATTAFMTGGQAPSLTGTDVNPQETQSVFNAMLKLRDALQNNDAPAEQRAMPLLDNSVANMNNAQAELGAREQGLQTVSDQITSEQTQLQSAMSTDYDADLTQAASDLMSRQTAYEASLRAISTTFQVTLFTYL